MFIGMMAFGVIWTVAGVILQQFLSFGLPRSFPDPGLELNFMRMLLIMRIATGLLGAGLIVLLRRILSES